VNRDYLKDLSITNEVTLFFCGMPHSTDADTHTRINTHHYEYTYAHLTHISTSEILDQLDLFTKSVKERLTVDGDVAYH
jgi:hypothetical protein